MTVELRARRGPATDAAIAQLRKRLGGADLPDDYARFLREHNGARPEPNVLPGVLDDSVGVNTFYSTSEALEALEAFAGSIPEHTLPIADAAGGNVILLALAELEVGRVFFFDHEIEDLRESAIAEIAETFESFLDRLEPDDGLPSLPPGVSLGHVIDVADDPEFDEELRRQGLKP